MLKGEAPIGRRLVAMAWNDEQFKTLLLQDPTKAAKSAGILPPDFNTTRILTVVENTPTVHNLIVCTLCSCYPTFVLGMSPAWYRSRSYRSRAVIDPRGLLREFGLHLDER
jgi:nitrile hydratase subunit alpha